MAWFFSQSSTGSCPDADCTTFHRYYLLATGGVNADQLSSTINAVNLVGTFEPLLPLSDTDVEVSCHCIYFFALAGTYEPSQGYLRHTHEQTIISSIEEGRRQTTVDFYRNLDSQMRQEWEKQKASLFEELGRHQAGTLASGSTDTPRRKGAGGGFDRNVSASAWLFVTTRKPKR